MEAIVGKIVAFVVADDELAPEEGVEFFDAKEAHAFARCNEGCYGGWYFIKLELPTGRIEYDAGFNEDALIGEKRYGLLCSKCHRRTWWHKRYDYGIENYCYECSN